MRVNPMERYYIKIGKEQGIEEGIEEGLKKGIEYGIEEGILQMAVKLIENGQTMNYATKISGLSKEEILKHKIIKDHYLKMNESQESSTDDTA